MFDFSFVSVEMVADMKEMIAQEVIAFKRVQSKQNSSSSNSKLSKRYFILNKGLVPYPDHDGIQYQRGLMILNLWMLMKVEQWILMMN